MRIRFLLCGVMLFPALLLAGCAMDQVSPVTADVASQAISGRSFGGQQPISGAVIEAVAFGTTGYGSPATVLATTSTDANGNFSFPANAYTCPQSDTPVYILGIGGDAGSGDNSAIVTAAGLGTCGTAQSSYVQLNEVTTVGLAFSLAHFFNTTFTAGNDSFGGPSTLSGGMVQYSKGLVLGNSYTIPSIIETPVGAPIQPPPGVNLEVAKINTIANVLAACINTAGPTKANTPCAKLFKYTTSPSGQVPTDTLQAAVEMALYPSTDVTQLFNLILTQPPFAPALATAPNDWTIAVSYTTSSLGLGVDAGTVSTLDIDGSGNIWFPSNLSGATGAAYFDPYSQTFDGPFNTTSMTHPQQVAIDANGYAWYNDTANPTVAGYLTTAPTTTPETASLPNTYSNALSIGGDDQVNVGFTNSTTYGLANISADRSSFSIDSGIKFVFPVSSVAGDNGSLPSDGGAGDGDAVTISDTLTAAMRSYYVTATPAETDVVNANDDSGQVIFTGNDDISVRSYSGSGNNDDGLCIYSLAKCYNFRGGLTNGDIGIAIDGASNLWIAESGDAGVLNVPVNSPGATDGAVYLNSSGATNIPANEYLHGPEGTDATGTLITPMGIGVDAEGNVWVSNAGCNTTDCTPGSFTLTEIVGAATPTITPVSAQITSGTNLVGTEPTN